MSGSDLTETADILRDMFFDKWGFGPPAPAHQAAYDRDLETVQWANGLGKSKARAHLIREATNEQR